MKKIEYCLHPRNLPMSLFSVTALTSSPEALTLLIAVTMYCFFFFNFIYKYILLVWILFLQYVICKIYQYYLFLFTDV